MAHHRFSIAGGPLVHFFSRNHLPPCYPYPKRMPSPLKSQQAVAHPNIQTTQNECPHLHHYSAQFTLIRVGPTIKLITA